MQIRLCIPLIESDSDWRLILKQNPENNEIDYPAEIWDKLWDVYFKLKESYYKKQIEKIIQKMGITCKYKIVKIEYDDDYMEIQAILSI